MKQHLAMMENETWDYEVMLTIKQGSVEVAQAAVVTDYSDALIFNKDVIDSRNERILQLGQEKVGILETMKEFRKKINQLMWQHKTLHLQKKELEEKTVDVQMLKVTKDVQAILRGESVDIVKRVEMQERKIEHVEAENVRKQNEYLADLKLLMAKTNQKRRENMELEANLKLLQSSVAQREAIRKISMGDSGGPTEGGMIERSGIKKKVIGGGGKIEENPALKQQAVERFGNMRKGTSMQAKAKQQTEELAILRQELDRLRQKTFPSFVQIHQDNSYIAD